MKPKLWEHVNHTNDTIEGGDATDYYISVWRLRVPGGWIYKTTEWIDTELGNKKFVSVSTCFVPHASEFIPGESKD